LHILHVATWQKFSSNLSKNLAKLAGNFLKSGNGPSWQVFFFDGMGGGKSPKPLNSVSGRYVDVVRFIKFCILGLLFKNFGYLVKNQNRKRGDFNTKIYSKVQLVHLKNKKAKCSWCT